MDQGYPEIDALVLSIKSNTNFLKKLFFPKVRLILVLAIFSVAIALRIILI
jgi:hypothetical protein